MSSLCVRACGEIMAFYVLILCNLNMYIIYNTIFYIHTLYLKGFPSGSAVKTLPASIGATWVQSLSQEDPLQEGIATHSSLLAWRIPWTEEPGGLQFIGSQRVRHD